MRIARVALPALLIVGFLSCLSYAASDRIAGVIDGSQVVVIKGNVHSLARPEFDEGRTDASRMLHSVSLTFRPSAAQQADLDLLLTQLQDPSSPNYHKFLTPAQFGSRFGMSQNDVNKIVAWLQAQGFHNISVASSRNEISFDGTVAQIESVFHTEMHNYLLDGEIYVANATEPSLPAAIAETAVGMRHLNSFAPKPRAQVRPNFTYSVTGGHFLSPDDFATIYDVTSLYSAGKDGAGQKIAIVGQSTVNATDLSNFRSAAGLAANPATLTLIEGTGTRCPRDEGESDLDIEWSGGVAKNATIIFLYAGLDLSISPKDSCSGSRFFNVWDALQYAVLHNVAPFISTSYGFCESGLPASFVQPGGALQTWAQQGQTQGQTIVSASGDLGAADCESQGSTSATTGLAVDAPASIPEVTGAGGNEFFGDNTAGADSPYWSGPTGGADTLSSALEWIPEQGWNDTATNGGRIAGSGGGASIYYAKPSWQTGAGSKREVPDISLTASADHDGYLFCSEDNGTSTPVSTCTVGFRTGAGGGLTVVGGTSAVAPTFSGILALINEYVGNVPPAGLAPLNPTLYQLAASHPTAFHDVTTGNNIVPCTTGTPNCASGSMGFSATAGYDEVTGLGSVNAFALAQVWPGALPATTTTLVANPTSITQGQSVTLTATVAPSTATGTVNFYVAGTTLLGTATLTSGIATLPTTQLPPGGDSVTAAYSGDSSNSGSTSSAVTVTVGAVTFTLTPTANTYPVVQGGTITATLNLTSTSGFNPANTPLLYTCSDNASESTCTGPVGKFTLTSIPFVIKTTPPTARLERPLDRSEKIFYAALLPGLLGIVFTAGSRKRSLRGIRLLSLIVVLGFSTLWMGSCGGSNGSTRNPGTPAGSYSILVTASTGGTNPIVGSVTINLVVTQ